MKIVKNRMIYFAVSIAVMIIGVVFAVINAAAGNRVLNFDVQFIGGTAIEANIGQEFDNDEIAELVKNITGDSSVQVQKTGDGTSVIIKTRYLSDNISESEEAAEAETEAVEAESTEEESAAAEENSAADVDEENAEEAGSDEEAAEDADADEENAEEADEDEAAGAEESDTEAGAAEEVEAAEGEAEEAADTEESDTKNAIVNALVEKYNIENPDQNVSINEVSATISTEMWQNALLAVLVACAAMLIYITIRFRDFRTGASVVIALLHDVLIVLAFYAIVRVPVNSTFIAAILTVLGYSVNASIVIFDRIRENRGKYAKLDKEEIVDKSINQSITRSVFTSLTTLLTIAALFIFGVQSVKEFALPIIVGIVCGTYSSVFLAGSLWYTISKK